MNNSALAIMAHEKTAWISRLDEFARSMEDKWGIGRLGLLVDPALAARFHRQLELWNECVWDEAGQTLPQIQECAQATLRGWQALDRIAIEAGATPLDPEVWEVPLPGGGVAGLCKTGAEAAKVTQTQSGRFVSVWSVEEIANVIGHHPELGTVKQTLAGAKVVQLRAKTPLLDDEIPF